MLCTINQSPKDKHSIFFSYAEFRLFEKDIHKSRRGPLWEEGQRSGSERERTKRNMIKEHCVHIQNVVAGPVIFYHICY